MSIHISLDLETWGTAPGCDIRSIGACVFDPVAGLRYTVPFDDTFYVACDNPIMGSAVSGWIETLGFTPHPDDKHLDRSDMQAGAIYRKYPLTRDPSTVQWWSEQSDEAQAAFTDPVDLREALERFSSWLFNVVRDPAVQLKECRKCHRPYESHHQICDWCGAPADPLSGVALWSHGAAFDPPILAAAYKAVGLAVPWHYRAPRDTRTLFDLAGIEDHSAWLRQHPGPLGIAHHSLDDSVCQARAICAAWRMRS